MKKIALITLLAMFSISNNVYAAACPCTTVSKEDITGGTRATKTCNCSNTTCICPCSQQSSTGGISTSCTIQECTCNMGYRVSQSGGTCSCQKIECPQGYYYSAQGQKCVKCPSTSTTEGTGATSKLQCLCPENYYMNNSDQCIKCPPIGSALLGYTEAKTNGLNDLRQHCYIPKNAHVKDAAGTYIFVDDCNYKENTLIP